MEKIKINMISGTSLEKPLITAFKGNGGEYVVLDNETNGTMGLPIILVSKLVNGRLSLIGDAEWNQVKEHLRLIIAGNSVDYVNVDGILSADDMFFKQLTLPVASFEALKNNYRPLGAIANGVDNSFAVNNNFSSVGPMPEVMNQNVNSNINPVQQEVEMPNMDMMAGQNFGPQVAPQPVNNEFVSPVAPTPDPSEVAPVMPSAPIMQQQSNVDAGVMEPVSNQMVSEVAPVVEPIPEVTPDVPVDFTADKEAFLKACENMFDALVAKMKN